MDPATVDDGFDRQWFNYVIDAVVNPGNLAAGQQLNYQLQIAADADFEWWFITGSRTSNLLKVLISEQATGRQFIGTTASSVSGVGAFQGVNFDLLCGTAQGAAAFPLAIPFVMPATRTYSWLFTDLSGAANTLEIELSGFKLWTTQTATRAAGTAPQSTAGGSTSKTGMQGWAVDAPGGMNVDRRW